MKIWCDVCSSKEASVFCSADEASLCLDCDPKVHQANKLASKHQRFSLLKPNSTSFPVCDICQEKKALLFCQRDRAILCKDCDLSIHAANEHTQKHSRYLLTGIKLSPSSLTLPPTTTTTTTTTTAKKLSGSASSGGFDQVPDFKSQKTAPASSPNYSEITSTLTNKVTAPAASNSMSTSTTASKDGSISQLFSSSSSCGNNSDGSTSSISEYLMEMLPGWQVEDLLDSSSLPFGYSKMHDISNSFLGTADLSNSSYDNMGLWVPQPVPPFISPDLLYGNGMDDVSMQNHHQARGETTTTTTSTTMHKKQSSRKKMTTMTVMNPHDGFMVPQISPQVLAAGSNKRSRPLSVRKY